MKIKKILNSLVRIRRFFLFKFDHLEYFIFELQNWRLFIAFTIIFSTPIIPGLKNLL